MTSQTVHGIPPEFEGHPALRTDAQVRAVVGGSGRAAGLSAPTAEAGALAKADQRDAAQRSAAAVSVEGDDAPAFKPERR